MPRMLRTTRRLPQEDFRLEAVTGFDGQGVPTYDVPGQPFRANAMTYTPAMRDGRTFANTKDGSEIRISLALYLQGTSSVVPKEQDRIRQADGRAFIVHERRDVTGLSYRRSEPDHYRILCKDA